MLSEESFMRRKLLAISTVAVLAIGAIVSSFYGIREYYTRRDGQDRLRPIASINRTQPKELHIGSTISNLYGHTITNQTLKLNLTHQRGDTLVLVLSPSCPYCRINFHNWRTIIGIVPPNDRVVWADLTGTADPKYLKTYGIVEKATIILLDSQANPIKTLPTPTTILLDSNGIVKWTHSGVLDVDQVKQIKLLLAS
jgi:hypothetical protein